MGRYEVTVKELLLRAEKLTRDNSSTILTALAVSGTITTAYLAAKATFKIGYDKRAGDEAGRHPATPKEYVKKYWRGYIPTAVSGTVTVACIVTASKINSRRAAALTAAYSLSEKAYSEYREKVIETLGEKKEKKVRDELAEARINNNPPPNSNVVLAGTGDVLCCEAWTGRYFLSNMETLRQAVNTVNAKINRENEATLSDFYYLIGLPTTSSSSYSGWTSDKLMKIDPSAILHEGRPCMVFEYNYVKTF